MRKEIPIYTIGYGARSIEDFIEVLKTYGIRYVLDIRTAPYSKYKPEFSKEALKNHLESAGIHYSFFGNLLGGRPDDPECYRDGQVDYDLCRAREPFQTGLARLREAWEKQLPVVLMCSEGKPQECHRSKMIGVGLDEAHIDVLHIDEEGKTKTQLEVMAYVTRGNQQDLFQSPFAGLTSRKKYQQNESPCTSTCHDRGLRFNRGGFLPGAARRRCGYFL